MATGLPVLSTRSGGPEEYITENEGILVPPGDTKSMVNGMISIHDNYDRFNPLMIRNTVRQKFGRNQFVQRWRETYREVVNQSLDIKLSI